MILILEIVRISKDRVKERMIKLANKISDETIEYVGILAKLELSEEEKEAAKKTWSRCWII